MLFLLISCFSLLLVSQSRMRAFPSIFYEALQRFYLLLGREKKIIIHAFQIPKTSQSIQKMVSPRPEIDEETNGLSLQDLPEHVLDHIIEKLTTKELSYTACTCSHLRAKCSSDYLWEKHLKQRWGGIIGDVAYGEWLSQNASTRDPISPTQRCRFKLFTNLLELFGYGSEERDLTSVSASSNRVMPFYLALETGKFWFPAQVLNREVKNGHVGFVLSSYDARLCYDSVTDNFVARYRTQERNLIEEGIEWNRIRPPSVNTPPDSLHISDCLDELKPDDHIEIQWRKNKQFPYGWWYGVVGHLESCGGTECYCQCSLSDKIVLEFKQYGPESRWRRTVINRKDHREVGNEVEGCFYGGIRKIYKKEEIDKWKQLWPNCTLE